MYRLSVILSITLIFLISCNFKTGKHCNAYKNSKLNIKAERNSSLLEKFNSFKHDKRKTKTAYSSKTKNNRNYENTHKYYVYNKNKHGREKSNFTLKSENVKKDKTANKKDLISLKKHRQEEKKTKLFGNKKNKSLKNNMLKKKKRKTQNRKGIFIRKTEKNYKKKRKHEPELFNPRMGIKV